MDKLTTLQLKVEMLEEENLDLVKQIEAMFERIYSLEQEVFYLRESKADMV